ncbi:hypothetical protein DM872_06605 [Pseudomonas taiwanensis]|nr:hypothetical protein [Pseudomonas taiwanensis]
MIGGVESSRRKIKGISRAVFALTGLVSGRKIESGLPSGDRIWREGTVKIHTRTGEIEEERTYPRSADLRRTKG